MASTRRRPPPRHARPSVFTPGRWVLPVSLAVLAAVGGGVGWAAASGAAPGALAAPQLAPAAPAQPRAVTAGPAGIGITGLPLRTFGPGPSSASATVQLHASLVAARDTAEASQLALDGIPVTALQAYQQAAARERGIDPSCGLSWPLLAGIGRVESDHGRFAGAVLHADGLSTPPIIGIPLNGHGTALIRDTDHGRLDGDTVYDNAVGPMQFIPSTWAGWGVDADHDGVANPFDIFDAAAAAADYLCAAGGNLATYAGQVRAVRSYNDSDAYITLVLAVEHDYAAGAGVVVPVAPGTGAPGIGKHHGSGPPLPPVNPGPPPAIHHKKHRHRPRPSRSPSATTSAPSSPASSPISSPDSSPASSPDSSPASSPDSSPVTGSPTSTGSSSPSSSAPSSGSESVTGSSSEFESSGASTS
jgi:hypothetical protein